MCIELITFHCVLCACNTVVATSIISIIISLECTCRDINLESRFNIKGVDNSDFRRIIKLARFPVVEDKIWLPMISILSCCSLPEGTSTQCH